MENIGNAGKMEKIEKADKTGNASEVKTAVILAAGFGTRFLPATKAVSKEMFPIVDKPALQYIVEEAVASGIERILVVTSRGKSVIEDYFDRNPELNAHLLARGENSLLAELRAIEDLAEIHYLRQKEALGIGHAVLCAEKFIHNESFALMLGDDLVQSKVPCLKQLIGVCAEKDSSVVAVSRVKKSETGHYGIAKAEKYGGVFRASGFVEKPLPEDAPSDYAILGRYVFKPEILSVLRKTKAGKNKEIQITDAINVLCGTGRVYAKEIDGKWLTVGNKVEYLKAVLSYAVKRDDLGNFKEFLIELVEKELKKN